MKGNPGNPQGSLAGAVLGKCKLKRKLGKGGMGEVYLAEHTLLRKYVAIKILPASFSRREQALLRFQREARAAARLEHPNIVQIHDVDEQNGLQFIVMQYVDGESLQERLDREAPLGYATAARIARDVASGLQLAHREGVVHRDIKPANILLGSRDEAKVTDFGLAHDSDSSVALTEAGDTLGTPHFISPEQAEGKAADGRADIYSLGVSLYYMITGEKPYTGHSHMEVMRQHLEAPPKNPRGSNPDIPAMLANICLKMMAKDPEDRYQHCGDLVRDLDQFLTNEPETEGATPSADVTSIMTPATRRKKKTARSMASPSAQLDHRGGGRKLIIAAGSAAVLIVAVILVFRLGGEEKPVDLEPDPEKELRERLSSAYRKETRGDLSGALTAFREALKLKPADAEVEDSIKRIQGKIARRMDEEAWNKVLNARGDGEIAAARAYLDGFPEGLHVAEAKRRLEEAGFTPRAATRDSLFKDFLGCGHLSRNFSEEEGGFLFRPKGSNPANKNETHILHSAANNLRSFILRAEIRLDQGNLVFMARDTRTGDPQEPGKTHRIYRQVEGLAKGKWQKVILSVLGDKFTIEIDGEQKYSGDVPERVHRAGRYGFRLWNDTRVGLRKLSIKTVETVDVEEIRRREVAATRSEMKQLVAAYTAQVHGRVIKRDYDSLIRTYGDFQKNFLTAEAKRAASLRLTLMRGAAKVGSAHPGDAAEADAKEIVTAAMKSGKVVLLDAAAFYLTDLRFEEAMSLFVDSGTLRPGVERHVASFVDLCLDQALYLKAAKIDGHPVLIDLLRKHADAFGPTRKQLILSRLKKQP